MTPDDRRERDPRVDPKPGDVLQTQWARICVTARLKRPDPNGGEYDIISIEPVTVDGIEWNEFVLGYWMIAMKTAEVIHAS